MTDRPQPVPELLERHLPRLRAYVRLRAGAALRSRESVSDIVQSVCREILEHADRLKHGGEQGFRRWLYSTAWRVIARRASYHRAARRDPAREEGDGRLLEEYGTFCTPSREVAIREELERIERAFDELSEDHKRVILLARVLRLPHAETAVEMNRSPQAVRALLRRALVELSGLLDRGAGGGVGLTGSPGPR